MILSTGESGMRISTSTIITFPGGALSGSSKILLCKHLPSSPNQMVIITEETPFHPLDYNWPDQPGDKGWITVKEIKYPIIGCFTAAFNKQTGEFLIDKEIKNKKVRRDDPNWFFLVAHLIEKETITTENDWIGLKAYLEVDDNFRDKISKAHSACHLASLALNKVTQKFWKKQPETLDSLGNPNLDAEAVIMSEITPEYSRDRYRCGKSLRKKGFDDAAFFSESEFKQTEANINKQLSDWCAQPKGVKIFVVPDKAYLHEKREWHCEFLDGKKAMIPCGGTHVLSIAHPKKVVVTLIQEGDGEFTMISKFIENP